MKEAASEKSRRNRKQHQKKSKLKDRKKRHQKSRQNEEKATEMKGGFEKQLSRCSENDKIIGFNLNNKILLKKFNRDTIDNQFDFFTNNIPPLNSVPHFSLCSAIFCDKIAS